MSADDTASILSVEYDDGRTMFPQGMAQSARLQSVVTQKTTLKCANLPASLRYTLKRAMKDSSRARRNNRRSEAHDVCIPPPHYNNNEARGGRKLKCQLRTRLSQCREDFETQYVVLVGAVRTI